MFILLYSYIVRNPELFTLHALDDVVQIEHVAAEAEVDAA